MKIKLTEVGFTNQIDIGKFSFLILIDEEGANIDFKELADQATHFNRVVFKLNNYDVLNEKSDIHNFIKRIRTKNESTIIEINTNGFIKPGSLLTHKNIIWNIFVGIKKTKLFKERINYDVLNEFKEVGANFIFKIDKEDELDEALNIIKDLEISKKQIYLMMGEYSLDKIISKAKLMQYNITAEVGGM